MKNLKLTLFVFLIFSSITIKAQYNGDYIIAAPSDTGNFEKRTIYNSTALDKMKFKEKYLYKGPFYGIPLRFGESISTKKYYIQTFYIDTIKVAYCFPVAIEYGVTRDAPYFRHAIYPESSLTRFSKGLGYILKKELYWDAFSVDSLNMLKRAVSDSVIISICNKNNYGIRYGEEYVVGDLSKLNEGTLVLKNTNGELRKIYICPDSKWNDKRNLYGITFKELLKSFIPRDSLIQKCKDKYNLDSLKILSDSLCGHEIYLNTSYYDFNRKLTRIPHGFYNVQDIEFQYKTVGSCYIACLKDAKGDSYTLKIPTNLIIDYIPAAEKRAEIEKERMERQLDEQERQKEEKQYYATLVRKYGKRNARLISEGCVEIGFTKNMCKEAWGEPYDVTSVTTQYGYSETWWYSGSFLVFNGNSLVLIQN